MRWLAGLTRNWAELHPEADDPALRPVIVPGPPDEALLRAAALIPNLPRWQVVSLDAQARTLRLTHTTRLWRFVDHIHLHFARTPDGRGTCITGRSQARIGRGDLGQNARNLRELTRALRSLECKE